jgi:hypothetical protein
MIGNKSYPFQVLVALWIIILITACSTHVDGGEFTFTAPAGYKTKTFDGYTDSFLNADYRLFTQNKHVYFQIFVKQVPQNSDMAALLAEHTAKSADSASHYQFISQNTVTIAGRDAVEYIHREFHGEPYVQVRELWIEKDGSAFILSCSEPVISTVGEVIPVAEDCIDLAEGFQFKEK